MIAPGWDMDDESSEIVTVSLLSLSPLLSPLLAAAASSPLASFSPFYFIFALSSCCSSSLFSFFPFFLRFSPLHPPFFFSCLPLYSLSLVFSYFSLLASFSSLFSLLSFRFCRRDFPLSLSPRFSSVLSLVLSSLSLLFLFSVLSCHPSLTALIYPPFSLFSFILFPFFLLISLPFIFLSVSLFTFLSLPFSQ